MENAKRGNLRGTNVSHDVVPPMLDVHDAQYGVTIGEMTKHDVDAVETFQVSAADVLQRNAKRFAIGTARYRRSSMGRSHAGLHSRLATWETHGRRPSLDDKGAFAW